MFFTTVASETVTFTVAVMFSPAVMVTGCEPAFAGMAEKLSFALSMTTELPSE